MNSEGQKIKEQNMKPRKHRRKEGNEQANKDRKRRKKESRKEINEGTRKEGVKKHQNMEVLTWRCRRS